MLSALNGGFMGYRSNGTGDFTLREVVDRKEALKALTEASFEIDLNNNDTITVRFDDWKIYYSGDAFNVIHDIYRVKV